MVFPQSSLPPLPAKHARTRQLHPLMLCLPVTGKACLTRHVFSSRAQNPVLCWASFLVMGAEETATSLEAFPVVPLTKFGRLLPIAQTFLPSVLAWPPLTAADFSPFSLLTPEPPLCACCSCHSWGTLGPARMRSCSQRRGRGVQGSLSGYCLLRADR